MYWLKQILEEDTTNPSYEYSYYEIIPIDYMMTLVTQTGSFSSPNDFLEYYEKNKRL